MKTKCEFCREEVEEPKNLNETYKCSHCGAIYCLELPEDLYLAAAEAAEYFGLESPEQIEAKITRNFDLLDGEEEVCLVFAKPR